MIVSTSRPRIWVSQSTLPALRAKAVPSNDRWQTLLNYANQPASWDIGIQNFALCYLITGDPSFAAKAWSLMAQSMSSGLGQVTGDSGYPCRTYLPAASVVLDWLSGWLQPGQKTQLVNDMVTNSTWVWPETNPSRTGAWGTADPQNNYFYGFLLTWMAGLSLYGETPQAQSFIDLALTKYRTMTLPTLAGPSTGGVWNEGTNYGTASTGFLLYNLLAHQSATGEDLISPTPWFRDMVTAMIHLTTPSMTEIAPFGDLGAGPVNDNHRRAMLLMAGRDPRAQIWLDQVTPNRMQQRLNAWLEFMFYPGAPVIPTGEKE